MSMMHVCAFFFFFNDTATTEIYTLSLHDALPIFGRSDRRTDPGVGKGAQRVNIAAVAREGGAVGHRDERDRAGNEDRKSTRLNSSHLVISYAVFCLKKKTYNGQDTIPLYQNDVVD